MEFDFRQFTANTTPNQAQLGVVEMGWNPETHDYCHGCSYYESVGTYLYELQSSLAKRKCKHLIRCGRVAGFVENMQLGIQLPLDDLVSPRKG